MQTAQNFEALTVVTRKLIPITLVMFSFSTANISFAQTAQGVSCGELTSGYGPYDYRVQRGSPLSTVENAHFTPKVENLISGQSDVLGADIDYTLHAFPNHHRALVSMARLGDKLKTNQPPGAKFTVECYFDRAVRYKKDDTVARGLYAQYLQKKGRKEESIKQLDIAAPYAKENPFSVYNIGLLYFEAGAFDKALIQAHLAQEMGFPRTELMDQLKKINKWQDTPTSADQTQKSQQ